LEASPSFFGGVFLRRTNVKTIEPETTQTNEI
jgi:hypothetical protein